MLVHRHVWENGTFSNWHPADRKHTNEDYANDSVFETREVTDRAPRATKTAKLALSFNEWGEPLTAADVDANVALYQNPPEYEVAAPSGAVIFPDNEETAELVERTKVRQRVA